MARRCFVIGDSLPSSPLDAVMDQEEPGSCWIDWGCGYRHGFWDFDAVGGKWAATRTTKGKMRWSLHYSGKMRRHRSR
jgi:hypothetical protein